MCRYEQGQAEGAHRQCVATSRVRLRELTSSGEFEQGQGDGAHRQWGV